MLGFAVSWS